VVSVFAEIIDGAFQTVFERHAMLPAGDGSEQSVGGEVIADIEAPTLGGEFMARKSAAAICGDQKLGKFVETHRPLAAKIEHLALSLGRQRREEEGIDCVVDIGESALLLATPDFERLAFEHRF